MITLKHIIDWYQSNGEIDFQLIKQDIAHTDDCPNQCKCRQNFARLVPSSQDSQPLKIHKFAQKYGFKGPWDGTNKLIKNCINKYESKLKRLTNAFDCYCLLSTDLTQESSGPKWQQCVDNRSENITKKGVWVTDRTFV